MTNRELQLKIINKQYSFEEVVFTEEIQFSNLDFDRKNTILTFHKCSFNSLLEIRGLNKTNITIAFHKCAFNHVQISLCKVRKIYFYNITDLNTLNIDNCNLDELVITSEKKLDVSEVNVSYTNIFENFNCNNLKVRNARFLEINYNKQLTEKTKSYFRNSDFDKVTFYGYFGDSDFVEFEAKECIFNTASFSESNYRKANFGENCNFTNCIFYLDAAFTNTSNIGELIFKGCSFDSLSHFDYSSLNNLSIIQSQFQKRASFDNLEVNKMWIFQSTFTQGAFFDELKINELEDSKYFKLWASGTANRWKGTLRTIKQELQKAENRIDYNRFRSYELQAYYQELKTNGTSFWNKDRLILYATKHATGFDHSWQKALGFVLLATFVFFSLFFVSENYDLPFAWSGIPQYITGYFRFLLVTDFYNPLNSGREYIANDGWNHIASWFIFILGKIFIAFGIYEMIQAFRKFKA